MSDLLAIRPGMIALRAKHVDMPSIAHRASTIVSLAETITAGPADADHGRRLMRDFTVNVAEIKEAIHAR